MKSESGFSLAIASQPFDQGFWWGTVEILLKNAKNTLILRRAWRARGGSQPGSPLYPEAVRARQSGSITKKMVFLYEYFLYKEEGPGFLDFMRNFGG